MAEPLSVGTLRPVVLAYGRALRWVLRHPFVVRPTTWALGLAAWFAVAFVVVTAGLLSWYSAVVLAALLLVPLVALFGWRRLTSQSPAPVVFLALFEPATPGAKDAAILHGQALKRRFTEGQLGAHVTLRELPVDVSREDAERLLDESGGAAVVYGRVKAIGSAATWEAELLARWPGEAGHAHLEGDVIEFHDRGVTLPDRHELVIEPRAPVESLIDERFEANHADLVQGTLLALVGADLAQHEEAGARACLVEAETYRDKLSTRTRAGLAMTRLAVEDVTDGAAALKQAERAAQADAGHVDLWNQLVALTYVGLSTGETTRDDLLRRAIAASAADPNDALARYNLGEAYVANDMPEQALEEFDRVAQDEVYAERPYLHMARGIVAYNLGRYQEARDAYTRAVELQPTARGHLYLGDAERALGNTAAARENYRQALLLRPDLVDAHRGYWYARPEDDEELNRVRWFDRVYHFITRVPGFDRYRRWRRPIVMWWLRRYYRRHPEDSRIHYMLGAHALIRGDLETAEERLRFATELIDHDYEALARLAAVHAFQGRRDTWEQELDELWNAPRPGGNPPNRESRRAIAGSFLLPFLEEPRLATRPGAEELLDAFYAKFQTAVGDRRDFMRDVVAGHIQQPWSEPEADPPGS